MDRLPRLHWAFIGAWLVLFTLAPQVASARAPSLAILGLASDDDETLAASLTDALRSEAAEDVELRLSDSHASLSQMTMAQDCDIADAACRTRVGTALHVDRVIYGSVRRAHQHGFEAELFMFTTSTGAQSSASRALPSGENGPTDLGRHARALLRALRGDSAREEGVDEAPAVAAVSAADVQPLAPTAADEGEPPERAHRASDDWLGYTLVAVAGVSLGVTVVSWTQINSADNNSSLYAYRKAVGAVSPNVADVCDEADKGIAYGARPDVVAGARSACSRGKTFQTLQYVFLGAALVSAGAGAYFLLNDESDRASPQRVALEPSVGRHGASISLRLAL
jgi:hypothetical protein